jgi:hypothetical protein
MAVVVVADLQRSKRTAKKAGSVREKRVRDPDGKYVRVLSLDANSPTLPTIF